MKLILAALVAALASLAVLSTATAASPNCSFSAPARSTYIGSAAVDSTNMGETSIALPQSGNYVVVACGVWNNTSHGYVDAAYNSGDAWNWNFEQQGWPGIAPNWGELQINDSTPSWGPYSSSHIYSTAVSNASGSFNMRIYDGDLNGEVAGWYGDNSGSLSVDVYELAPPMPTSADQCKKNGWQTYGVFKNQGDCVSYVATGGKNLPANG